MNRTNGTTPPVRETVIAPSPSVAPLRILVVEDNEFNRRHLERLLARRSYDVRMATNGREALALLGVDGQGAGVRSPETVTDGRTSLSSPTPDARPLTTDFDLMLLDLHMPQLDGFQVIRAIREREQAAGGHLPVIALTARSRQEDRESCLAAGMDEYLSKPIRAAEVFATIDRMVADRGVSTPHQAETADGARLLDPVVLLASCGDDEDGLRGLCEDLRIYAPARLAEVGDALRVQDAPRLREAAHKLRGLLSVFSTLAGDAASNLEDQAALGRLDGAQSLVRQLESMAQRLIRQVDGLSCNSLRRQAEAVHGSGSESA
jgi:two-component system sensor histidine kinase/response regulator